MQSRTRSHGVHYGSSRLAPPPVIDRGDQTPLAAPIAQRAARVGSAEPVRKRVLKVLVTDAHYKHALAIVRSLGLKGHEVTVLATSPDNVAAKSRYCSGIEYITGISSDIPALLGEILRRRRQDFVIPVAYLTTLALAREKHQLTPLTRLEIADYEKIVFAADKVRVRNLAAGLGILTPETVCPQSIGDLNASANHLRYPVIVKARSESAGITVRMVETRKMLFSAYDFLMAESGPAADSWPIIQEYIPGYGCGFFALYQDGVCKRVFMHRRIRENPPVGGISCCAESFYDPLLKELSTRLLDKLGWHGVAMVEFRYDIRDRQYKLLEINPKFWGSLDLALAAGVDFPGDLCGMATGIDLGYSERYRKDLRFHWFLSGDLQHALSKGGSLPAVLVDCLNPRVKSNLWLNDLGPTWSEARSLLQSAWRRLRKT